MRLRKAPFDHPSLPVRVGHQMSGSTVVGDGFGRAVDLVSELPATGRDGVHWSQQLPTFLDQISSQPSTPGTGLLGNYYGLLDLQGAVKLKRVEPLNVSVPLLTSPGAPLTPFAYSVRWEGSVKTGAAGNYQFQTLSNNGIRVWIDGKLVIDNWWYHLPKVDTGASMALPAGTLVSVVVEYQQWTSGITAQLRWLEPGAAGFATIPASRLYAPAATRAGS